MHRSIAFRLLSLMCLMAVGHAAAENLPLISKGMNEQVIMLPVGSGLTGTELETTLFIPPGGGPFPLVIINHGKASGNPKFQSRARYLTASREFFRRGYLVAVPMRRGFSKSGNTYIDPGCNIESNGQMRAEEIAEIVRALAKRSDVDRLRILLIGQSHGGLSVMATANGDIQGVLGILNFAGGYRYTGQFCTWERSLVNAFASFGKGATIPSVWFYGDNDSYWGKDLPKEMYQAFTAAGGKADLVSYGVFEGGDAHNMFSSSKGLNIWWPATEAFLKQIGLPTDIRFELATTPRPAKTDFAALEDDSAVPYLDDRRRELYRQFLKMPQPRAFAIAPSGNVGWAKQGSDPLAAAVTNCERMANMDCKLYAVDGDVVWVKE
jgi:dienelactone hydrolase